MSGNFLTLRLICHICDFDVSFARAWTLDSWSHHDQSIQMFVPPAMQSAHAFFPWASPSVRARCEKQGFTLLEILTVIAIVGVLAALLLPVISSIRKSVTQASTLAAMRQIGVAMNQYVAEHDGVLPGPMSVAVFPYGREVPQPTDVAHLGLFLAPYIGAAGSGTSRVELPGMQCPALSEEAQKYENFVANYVVPDQAGNNARAMGYRFGEWCFRWGEASSKLHQPKRLIALTDEQRRLAYLSTADQETWGSPSNTSLPEKGVFDGQRMWLFLDGGVALSPDTYPFAR